MIAGISIYEILTVTSILFFIGVYGFITRKNLISVLISIELILNASVVNFVVINKYLYPEMLQGVIRITSYNVCYTKLLRTDSL